MTEKKGAGSGQDSVGLVLEALDDVRDRLRPEQRPEAHPDAILLGEDGPLDSLAVITLLTALEEKVQRRWGRDVVLFDVMLAEDPIPVTVREWANRLDRLRAPAQP